MLSLKRIKALSFWIALGLFGSVSMTWVSEAQAMDYYASNRDLRIARGGSVSSAIQVIPYGSTGLLTFTLSGGNGITAVVPPINITTNGDINSRVTFYASATATTGNQNLVLTGRVGSSSYRQSFTLNVSGTAPTPTPPPPTPTPVPSFSMALSPVSVSAVQGASASSNITLSRTSFTSAVTFSVAGLPSGVTSSFSANNTSSSASTITFNAASSVAVGAYPLTLTAVGGSLTQSAALNLNVTAAPVVGTYNLSVAPASVSLTQGQSPAPSVTVNITRTSFTSAVALSIAGYPSGVTPAFGSASTTGTSTTLSLPSSSTAALGTFSATISAVSGGITRTAPLSITVNPAAVVPANFTMSASPTSLSIRQPSAGAANNTGNFTLNLVRTNLPASLSFAVTGNPAGVSISCPSTTSTSSSCSVSVASSASIASSTLNIQSTAAGVTRTSSVTLSVTAPVVSSGLKAFPSAEGFGAVSTSGGRGGVVCKVTNLNTSGAGSLQACMDLSGPAYIIFTVSGLIDGSLECHVGNKTVAGQTSPAGIITRGIIFDDVFDTNPLCSNVILRHLRSRPAADERTSTGYVNDDAIRVEGTKNVVIDHISLERASDECFQLSRSSNVTVQNSICAETLGDHYWGGMLINYSSTAHNQDNFSIHHNLWTGQQARFPEIACEENGDRLGTSNCANKHMKLELSNNMIYDPTDPIWYSRCTGNNEGNFCAASAPSFFLDMNWIGNYMRDRTGSDNVIIGGDLFNDSRNHVYYADDFFDTGIAALVGFSTSSISSPFPYPQITYTPGSDIPNYMINNVGAFPRDAMDQRLVGYISQNINSTPLATNAAARGRDTFNLLTPACASPADTDNDGMPDVWETLHGLNPNVDDHNGTNLSSEGYSNLEVYLEELNNQVVARGSSTNALCTIASW